uniref:V-type proton ATPase subunit S1/VOA1 transmembrane domain-containing protein n=1 Tax=Rhizophora mucronata TaxID=61149 RepID=A0A2P2M211_RHIMU
MVLLRGVAMWFLMILSHLPFLLGFQSTMPAFLWSPHHQNLLQNRKMDAVVNYQTISLRDLAKSVLAEGRWSNFLCSEENVQQPLDLALVFVGRELLSSDISAKTDLDPDIIKLLKVSFARSNFSMAFPYVVAPVEETIENSLLLGFTETCGQELEISKVAFSESCSVQGGHFEKLADMQALNDYLISKTKNRPKGPADLVVFCHGGSDSRKGLEDPQSESEVLSGLISSMETLGTKYTVLYISEPLQSVRYSSHRGLERFLADSSTQNGSLNSPVCDQVCQIKSSLLEGVLVGIVLLVILISGLCCMMGIDTPSRFEALQDS